jgi:hypothetical protein
LLSAYKILKGALSQERGDMPMREVPGQDKKDMAALLKKHRQELRAWQEQQGAFEQRLQEFREQQQALQAQIEVLRMQRHYLNSLRQAMELEKAAL